MFLQYYHLHLVKYEPKERLNGKYYSEHYIPES